MMGSRVERGSDPTRRPHALRHVATQFECRHARDVCLKGQNLQVEHQLDVILPRIRYAHRSVGQFARFTAGVVCFDSLNSTLNLANIVQVLRENLPIAGELGLDVVAGIHQAAERATFIRPERALSDLDAD